MKDSGMDYEDKVLNQTVTIRYKSDRTVPQRCMNQAIGKLWTPVQEAMVAAGKWQQGMKLGSTGRNGDLFLTDGEQGVQRQSFIASSVFARRLPCFPPLFGVSMSCL